MGCGKNIWKVHVLPKAKHLLWRICKDCLPTRVQLQEKNVQCPLDCPICEHEVEIEWHSLFDCNDSRNAWQAAGLTLIISQHMQSFTTTRECILHICSETDKNTAGKIAMLIWVLWNNRNNAVWNQTKEMGQQLGVKAMCLWSEWDAVQVARNSNIQAEQQQQITQWQRPAQGWYKCNVDAGLHHGKTTAGWCIKDNMGVC
ncbi:hypothetical protein TSUD_87850 [Trifolium subterraneum]|uniref:Reverse transcriptase zinc-binding domain-containing protein n=1 Tax=Trifolium subterraneum TaxID=3900 RepID=A0A2Z6NUX1_TRISU|nr:hypothetical protein TSUD_87850 [Trifolium subterraneum]